MTVERYVVDASAAVKWFRVESGREVALEILSDAAAGKVTLSAPTHCVHEILSVVRRRTEPGKLVPAWETLMDAGVDIIPLTDEVVREAAAQCATLGCSFYDALAPACAALLGATLVSADARAHSDFPRVRLIG